jgi:hypothetical protein
MFNFRPEQFVPGLHNFRLQDEFTPGLHNFAPPDERALSFPVNDGGADQTLQSPGQSQMSGDVIPICSLVTRLPGQCVYWCEAKGANVATSSNGYCPSIIRQPPWL